LAKVFKLITLTEDYEDTNEVYFYRQKNRMCEDFDLTPRLLSRTATGERRHHKGYRLEILEIDDVSAYKLEDLIEVGSEEERKPSYTENESDYIFHTSKRDLIVDKDKVRDIMKLYCVDKKTINQTAMAVGLLRDELVVVLNGLGITKDSVPFIDEDFDNMTVDEMAEHTRIEKKRAYFRKLEENKIKDMENELKNRTRKDYLYDKIIERVKPLNSSFTINPEAMIKNSDTIYHKFTICDVHAGLEIDSYFNTYNLSIMKDRFIKITNDILSEVDSGNIDIILGGDDIHGKIKGSIEKNSDFIIKSTISVIDCYISLLKTLLDTGRYNIRVCKVNGSHESLESAKTDRTKEENLGELIIHSLIRKFEDYTNIEFIDKFKNTPFVLMPYFNYTELVGHGDEMSMDSYVKFAQQLNKNIRYISLHHLHHYKSEMLNGIGVTYNESFCGTDQYAQGLGLFGEFGVRYAQYDESGKISEKLIRIGGGN